MLEYHLRRRSLIIASSALLSAAVLPARAAGDEAVLAPVQRLIAGLLSIMKAGMATPFQLRFATLGPVIDQSFDLETILKQSVGSTWGTLPPDQQNMLEDAFRRYTVASYVNSFDNYNGQRFDVSPQTRTVGADQVVQTHLIPKSGESHELDYVVRQQPAGWKVVDVLAEGSISRVAVQRSDFRRLLARGGAQALADTLRAKSADMSDGGS
jgi:phospholipid transport system substrate-binding protein